jgi:hypothetical protein
MEPNKTEQREALSEMIRDAEEGGLYQEAKLTHSEKILSGLRGLEQERDFYKSRCQTLEAQLGLVLAWYQQSESRDEWMDRCVQDMKNAQQMVQVQEAVLPNRVDWIKNQ